MGYHFYPVISNKIELKLSTFIRNQDNTTTSICLSQ